MTVAVAHHSTTVTDEILVAAVREAAAHGEDLAVINVIDTTDLDLRQALEQGIADKVEAAQVKAGVSSLDWQLHLLTASSEGIGDVAQAVLDEVERVRPSMLVIGARRRSPVGKAFLGSVTQHLILDAELPVLVVKGTATTA